MAGKVANLVNGKCGKAARHQPHRPQHSVHIRIFRTYAHRATIPNFGQSSKMITCSPRVLMWNQGCIYGDWWRYYRTPNYSVKKQRWWGKGTGTPMYFHNCGSSYHLYYGRY